MRATGDLVIAQGVVLGMCPADIQRMEAWVIGVLVLWALVTSIVALVLGRGIRLADARSAAAERPLTTADLPVGFTPRVGASRR